MRLWKKKSEPPPQDKPPRRVTISDVMEYHSEKDACDNCKDEEWGCVQHPYNPHNPPRPVSAVIDKPYYLTYVHGVPHQVDKDGRFRSGRKADGYALILAGTLGEAKAKFGRGEVEERLS